MTVKKSPDELPEGTQVTLVREPSRRGVVIESVSTWRVVKWVGRGASNHRPSELEAVVQSRDETPSDVQQQLDDELVMETADGRKIGNRVEGLDRPQIVASYDGEWRLECTVCGIPNLLNEGMVTRAEIVAQAKRHVGACRSTKPVRQHWAKLSELLGETLVPPKEPKKKEELSGRKRKKKRPSVRTWGHCSRCDEERAVVVSLCGDPAHSLCEPHAKSEYGGQSIADMLEDPTLECFACRSDEWVLKCWVCGKQHNTRAVLLCAKCPRAFHAGCLGPGAKRHAQASWLCAACENRSGGPDAASVLAFDAVKAKVAPYKVTDSAMPKAANNAAKATLAALRRHDFAKYVLLPVPDHARTALDIVTDVRAALRGPFASVAHSRMAVELNALADKCFDTFVFPRIDQPTLDAFHAQPEDDPVALLPASPPDEPPPPLPAALDDDVVVEDAGEQIDDAAPVEEPDAPDDDV